MVNYRQTLFLIFILVSMPLSGCIDASEDSPELKGETLA
jgi:hypothetical protein